MALKTDASIRPFVFLERIPLEFTALENQSEEGFMRDRFLYGVRVRCGIIHTLGIGVLTWITGFRRPLTNGKYLAGYCPTILVGTDASGTM